MVRCRWLGRIDFATALALQQDIVHDHARHGDTLLLLEHDPVYTTGRGGRAEFLPSAASLPPGVPVLRIGRGGEATYHGPGQLVGYALVDLRRRGGDVHRFLRSLEAGVVSVIRGFGVAAAPYPGRTGAWVFDCRERAGSEDVAATGELPARKIASIGIGVRRGISLHGFAINVSVDLSRFACIVPCGIAGVRMTSIEAETGRAAPALDAVAEAAAHAVPLALAAADPRPMSAEQPR
jgi:lipoyl(octanoyl) transferase